MPKIKTPANLNFDRNGVYLPTKKIGKNNPKGEQIKTDNQYRTMWNQTVDRALISDVPEMPKKSVLASKYPRLADIYHKLKKQNTAIYEREKQLTSVEKELVGAKGIFKAKQRKELQEQAEQQTGNKAEPDSLKAKLQRKTQEVKERENNRQSHHYRSDRGGR